MTNVKIDTVPLADSDSCSGLSQNTIYLDKHKIFSMIIRE